MTREEAISRLKAGAPFSEIDDSSWNEALDMAISSLSAEGEYIKKEDALDKIVEQLPQRAYMKCQKAIESLPTYSFPDREKGTDGTLVYNANGHFYGVMDGDAIMDRMRGKDNETNN